MVGTTEENADTCVIDLPHKRCCNRDLGVIDYDDPDIGQGYFIEDCILMVLLDDETSVLDAEVLRGADRNRQ